MKKVREGGGGGGEGTLLNKDKEALLLSDKGTVPTVTGEFKISRRFGNKNWPILCHHICTGTVLFKRSWGRRHLIFYTVGTVPYTF